MISLIKNVLRLPDGTSGSNPVIYQRLDSSGFGPARRPSSVWGKRQNGAAAHEDEHQEESGTRLLSLKTLRPGR